MLQKEPIPQATRRIVLVGFMGAGKSTVGDLLAKRIGWRFVDIDRYVEEKHGCTIPQIFSDCGESAFRQMEAAAIAELLPSREIVIALGGGALEAEETRFLLHRDSETRIVFLKAGLDILIDRCEKQPKARIRPILEQREALSERFQRRLEHYEQAHATVVTEGRSPETVAEEIVDRLGMMDRTENAEVLWPKERAIVT